MFPTKRLFMFLFLILAIRGRNVPGTRFRSYRRSLTNPIESNASNRLKWREGRKARPSGSLRQSSVVPLTACLRYHKLVQNAGGSLAPGWGVMRRFIRGTNNANFLQYGAVTLRQNEQPQGIRDRS